MVDQTESHEIQYMLRALSLALEGKQTVSPNPLVGAVIVKNGKVIGEGYHLQKGGPHAEVNAIENSCESVEGATLFCTLEPCCHTNKTTPPCTELIIEKKIAKVVVGSLDPNPHVSGKGVQKLLENNIEVKTGVLKDKCDHLNQIFFKNMKEALPFVHLKMASTLDGRMVSSTGSSKWITSPEARDEVHDLRLSYDAVMIGKNTLINDNPQLTARRGKDTIKDPFKIIVGDLSQEAFSRYIFKDATRVINIFNDKKNDKVASLKKAGTWSETLSQLYGQGICSVLVEGGPTLISSFLDEGCFDRLTVYIAPKLIGNGKSILESTQNLDMEKLTPLNGSWRILKSGEAVFEVGA